LPHRRRWPVFVALIVGLVAVLTVRAVQRSERANSIAKEIRAKGGTVSFGPSRRDVISYWLSGHRVEWNQGSTVLLRDDVFDDTWLKLHDDLADLRIGGLYLNFPNSIDAVGLIRRHPLREYSANRQTGTDAAAAALATRPRLLHVDIGYSDLSDSGLSRLPLEQLESLCINGTKVTASGLGELHRCRKLVALTMGDRQLDSTVVATLTQLPQLESVTLIGREIGDQNIQMIANLQSLPYLHLQSTTVTASGARKLRTAMPACEIRLQ
jgi:hypothetical protein